MYYFCTKLYRLLSKTRSGIVAFIDFFHKPFAKFIPAQTCRYIACGGTNTVLGLIIFSLVFTQVFHKQEYGFVLMGMHISARVASLSVSTCFNVPFGFVLSSYVVFPESQIDTRVQFVRYTVAAISFIFISYLLTKFFAYAIPMVRADVANIFVVIITAIISYISQKFYTFKIDPQEETTALVEEEAVAEEA